MTASRIAVLGLGSNLGSRAALLRAAATLLDATPGVRVVARSTIYETAPLGPPQPNYLNAALAIATTLPPRALLAAIRRIERTLERRRDVHWGPRTLDVDILWIDGVVISRPDLTVPHPALLDRPFAIGPLLELVPDARDPRSGRLLSAHAPSSHAIRAMRRTPFAAANAVGRRPVRDRADALARAAERALGMPTPRSHAFVKVPLRVTLAASCSRRQRLAAWLAAVRTVTIEHALRSRHAVIFDDGARSIRGALIGVRATSTLRSVLRSAPEKLAPSRRANVRRSAERRVARK